MSLDLRILMPSDKEALMAFARRALETQVPDKMERELQSWTARWREEALNHYLPQGWSFGAFAGGEVRGFLLGQPFLFFRGLTQTLWLEHGEFADHEVGHQLLDAAYKWARDKHLQCVLSEGSEALRAAARDWKPARVFSENLIEIKSARF